MFKNFKKIGFCVFAVSLITSCGEAIDYKYDSSRGTKDGYNLLIKTLKHDFGSKVQISSFNDPSVKTMLEKHPEDTKFVKYENALRRKNEILVERLNRGRLQYADVVVVRYINSVNEKTYKIIQGECKKGRKRCDIDHIITIKE